MLLYSTLSYRLLQLPSGMMGEDDHGSCRGNDGYSACIRYHIRLPPSEQTMDIFTTSTYTAWPLKSPPF